MLGCSGLVVRVDGRKPLLSMDDPLSLSEDFRRMGRDLRHVGDRVKSGVDLDRGYLYIVAGWQPPQHSRKVQRVRARIDLPKRKAP